MANYSVRWKLLQRIVRTIMVVAAYFLVVGLAWEFITRTPPEIFVALMGSVLVVLVFCAAWYLVDL